MNTRHIFIPILAFFLIFNSCKKDEPGGNHHYLISENLHSLLFNIESYWIYENINTKESDSISIVEVSIDTLGYFHTGKGCSATYQAINLDYLSAVYGDYSEQYVGYIISKGSLDGGYVYLASFNEGETNDNATIANVHDSLIINDNLYLNVVEMDIRKDEYIENDMRLFYVDSIGIIKKEIFSGDTIQDCWILLKHSIDFFSLE